MATDGDKIISYLELDISGYQAAMEEAIQLMKEAGQEGLTAGKQISGMGNGIETMGKQMTTGAEALTQLTEKLPGISNTGQQIITTISDIMGAAGSLMNISGTLMKMFSGPAGWIALLTGAGVAGVMALGNIRQAAVRANLEERFGNITLSAQEMKEAIDAIFAGNREKFMPFSANLKDAQQTLDSAVEDFNNQQLTVDKMLIRAELGLEVDSAVLVQEAEQLSADAKTAIEAQQIAANLAVDAVFGKDDEDGERLREAFNAYFTKENVKATEKGIELANAIEQGLQDGFLDEVEQATIDALRKELYEITARATSLDTQTAKLRFRMEAQHMELTPESIHGLLLRANEVMQAGINDFNFDKETLINSTYHLAVYENWSDERLQAELDGIERRYQENIQGWMAESAMDSWELIGSRVMVGYDNEAAAAKAVIDQAVQEAQKNTADHLREYKGMKPGDDGYAEAYAEYFQSNLSSMLQINGWSELFDNTTQAGMWQMYEALQPQHEAIRNLAAAMGDELPAELKNALADLNLLEIMATGMHSDHASLLITEMLDMETMSEAGQQIVQTTAEGMAGSSEAGAEQGGNLVKGYVGAMEDGTSAASQAGRQLVQASTKSMATELKCASPSRVTAQYGAWAVDGYVGSLDRGVSRTRLSGAGLARASLQGLAQGLDAHSPSRAMGQYGTWAVKGYVEDLDKGISMAYLSGVGLGKVTVKGVSDGYTNYANIYARLRQQREKELDISMSTGDPTPPPSDDGIRQTAAATLAADQAAYQQRMNALNGQYQSLMSFAGSHAIWYQDDKGETEVKATKKRYDDLIDEENKRYEAEKKRIEAETTKKNKDAQQQRLDALKEAHEDRAKLLKEQRDEETEAMKKQYSLQKEMATDWLNSQKSLLSAELSAKRAAYAEDDYQDELADLQKRQRQSKSAREKRELQEQIDKMIRDHALEAEEAALQETLAGYDALIKAVGKGLIGLGDLTGSSAYGELSFGTAGLSALDNLTAQQLQNVMASLDRGALSGGVGATVSSAQMAAALRSASGTTSAPVVVTQEGRNYTIDLRGAIVRDDSDIDRIMDEMDRRLRAAGR